MIKTKLKTLQAFSTILASVFFAIISIALIEDSSSEMEGSPGEVAFAFFTIFFAIYFPYNLLQKCPRVIFEEDSITVKYLFSTKKYVWSSITDIFFSTREYYAFFKILGRDMESTCIHFDNNEKIILWEEWYSNLPKIRQYIFAKVKVKVRDKQSTVEKSSLILFENKVYAGNPWITRNTATMLIPAIFFGIGFGKLHLNSFYLFPLLIIPFLISFFAIGTQMNYFIVNGETLTIKNHFFYGRREYSIYMT